MSGSRLCVERGLRYHFRLWGSQRVQAPAAVFLHGFAGSSRDWERFGEAVDRLGLRAMAIDLPGHGDTESPADPARFTVPETARDLNALLELTGIAEAHWVGYSMGGRIALYTAAAYPDRTRSIVAESASPGFGTEPERAARRTSDEALAREIEARGIDWFATHWAAQPIFASQATLSEKTLDSVRAARRRNHAAGLAGSLRGAGQGAMPDLAPMLSAIRCPALFVTGSLDTRYRVLADGMADAIAGARHLTVPAAGHNVHLERPEAFERALVEHLVPFASAAQASARSSL